MDGWLTGWMAGWLGYKTACHTNKKKKTKTKQNQQQNIYNKYNTECIGDGIGVSLATVASAAFAAATVGVWRCCSLA